MIVMDVLESLLAEATALTSRSNSPFECSSLTDHPDLPSNFKGGGDVVVDSGLQLATSNGDTKFCFKALTAQIIREPAKAGFCFSTYSFNFMLPQTCRLIFGIEKPLGKNIILLFLTNQYR